MTAPAPTAEPSRGHAAAMDRMYRLTRHVYDATRRHYLLGRDRMIAGLAVPPGGAVLEMGCGTARNLVAVARAYPSAALFGFDISAEMLKTADANIARAGLHGRARLVQGDATRFDAAGAFGRDAFDRVYFSYTLSMVPDWKAALAEGLRLTAPDGSFSVVDFGFCEGLGSLARGALHAWLRLFHVTPRADLEAEMRRLAAASGRPIVFERPYGGYAQLGRIGPVA